MKIDRHGQAKILKQEEIDLIFNQGLTNEQDRAMFAICLYTACRINECVSLRRIDVYERKGVIHPEIIFRKGNTKGQLSTRCIPVIEDLRRTLINYYPGCREKFCFPGIGQTGHIHPDSAARVFRKACSRVGIKGASTHSFRRTALTQMSNAGIPLRVIQEISGHRDLAQLQRYLEVTPEQVKGAVSALSMLTPVGEVRFSDLSVRKDERITLIYYTKKSNFSQLKIKLVNYRLKQKKSIISQC